MRRSTLLIVVAGLVVVLIVSAFFSVIWNPPRQSWQERNGAFYVHGGPTIRRYPA